MTTFAETSVQYPDGQLNVYPLPENILSQGFAPKQSGVRGQPLAANWLNWLFRELFRRVNKDRLTNGNGSGVLSVADSDSFITIHAMVKTDNTKWLSAIGYKTGNGIPVFKVTSSGTLSLGTVTATDIPITGATATDIALRVTVTGA